MIGRSARSSINPTRSWRTVGGEIYGGGSPAATIMVVIGGGMITALRSIGPDAAAGPIVNDGGPIPEGPAGMAVRRKPRSRAIPITLGPAMLPIPTSPPSAIRPLTPGRPGRTSGRSTPIRKSRSTGVP